MKITTALALATLTTNAFAQQPRRSVPDPGVIATGMQITPAGVQTIFNGRVSGVRFGRTSNELWITTNGNAWRMDWKDNVVRAHVRAEGRSGVNGLSIDRATGRVFISSVGRLPTPRGTSQLLVFAGDAVDSVAPLMQVTPLGDFMAGTPAIAQHAASDGRRYAVLPLPANDSLVILDAVTGDVVRKVALGVEPISAVISTDGGSAYVTVLGGAKPAPGERFATQRGDPRAEAVRVDARGIAEAGSVAHIELATGKVLNNITVGRHPIAIAADARGHYYVADANSDAISVIDGTGDAVIATISVAPFREKQIGVAPTALVVSPDARTLFVTLGGVNAIAAYDVSAGAASAKLLGLIPTAWYPATLDISDDGRWLAVGTRLGVGSGTGHLGGDTNRTGRQVYAERGSVSVIAVPTRAEYAAYTTAVSSNAHLHASNAAAQLAAAANPFPPAIKHVVFIVRENRTYDQILGDLGRGNSDSTLTIYGRAVTPNTHALAEQFVTLDHFFASGGNSADGHQWLTQANETVYPMWPLYYGRSYPYMGVDPLVYSSGGFLWEAATSRGRSVTIFGEYAPSLQHATAKTRAALLALWDSARTDYVRQRALLQTRYNTHSEIASLDRALVREYPGWTLEVPDVVKAGDILAHLADWEKAGSMPDLVMVILPNDHTAGTSPGYCTPRACVADNDYGLGLIADGFSHSRFWKNLAMFVVEDDAQDGVDHIDGHRTVALAISPYTRRGAVDATFYNQASMVKTIEMMLGLPALSLFDLVATDMRNSFVTDGKADLTPYKAIVPDVSLAETNPPAEQIRGSAAVQRRNAALASAKMLFDGPDEAPSERLNRILWHDAKGWNVPYPAVKQSLFFPLSVHIDDQDRDGK